MLEKPTIGAKTHSVNKPTTVLSVNYVLKIQFQSVYFLLKKACIPLLLGGY
jgi:hypothetical protein